MMVTCSLTLRIFLALACLAVFCYQMSFILRQWLNEETTIGLEIVDHKRLKLPAITICAQKPFRTNVSGDPITEEEYLATTFDLEDLFPSSESNSLWNVSATRCFAMGRCYTFSSETEFKAVTMTQKLTVQSHRGMNIYGHHPGEEFWLWNVSSPVKMAMAHIPSSARQMGENFDLHVERVVTEVYDRGDNCGHYTPDFSFLDCAKKAVTTLIAANATCRSPEYKGVFDGGTVLDDLPMCATTAEKAHANDVAGRAIILFVQDPGRHSCVKPCSMDQFDIRFNSFPSKRPEVNVFVYYDTVLVKRHFERLIYDLPGFLSALGGSLGLYLGLSCLSVLYGLIEVYPKLSTGCGSKKNNGSNAVEDSDDEAA